jgi:predicted membrane protein DUF2238
VWSAVADHRALVAFAAGYVVAFTIVGLVSGSPLTIPYAVIVATLFFAVAFVHSRVSFGSGVLWALGVWGLVHMAGGVIELPHGRVLYNAPLLGSVVRYDRLVHAFGFGTATAACWQALRRRLAKSTVTGGTALLIALMGLGVGAVNETIEFIASQLIETNVGGYVNTGWDLIANTIGCTAVAYVIWRRHQRAQPP